MTKRRLWNARALLALAACTVLLYWTFQHETSRPVELWSRSTGTLGALLIASTLVVGPFRVLRGHPALMHFAVRRDLGIWAGVFTLAHVALGIRVHMKHWWEYFAVVTASGPRPRVDAFGITNWIGVGATLIILGLWYLSSDDSMRRLGTSRWKRWQGWNYALFPLVVVHALVFQWLDRRPIALLLAVVIVALITCFCQLAGRRRYRAAANSRIESIT